MLLAPWVWAQNTNPKVTWHWHMHQPIYWNDQWTGGVDRYEYAWDSIQAKDGGRAHPENDLRGIFGNDDRVAAYQWRVRNTLASIGSHLNSGAQITYSGALMENVNSLGQAGQLNYTSSWKSTLAEAHGWTTTGGKPRLDITNFSFHHALLPLHNPETVYMELKLMQEKVREEFGSAAVSRGLFPTEMAFSTRLIPELKRMGIEWAIVSSEHIARACPDFPIQYGSGGINCDPPNRADQLNPNGESFIRTSIDRGCSPVAANPLSYQPAYVKYVDPNTGEEQKIIAVPADQALGWKDGYSAIGADFMTELGAHNNAAHPSLVVLAHDGDNAWGGGYSYYMEAVPNLANDVKNRGGEAVTVEQYLLEFPPAASSLIHVEDGSWVNADSDFGSPIFINWNYPLLTSSGQIDPANGWHEKPRDYAIFTAALNRVLTAQQISGRQPDFTKILHPDSSTHDVDRAWHYFLGSLDSGNVYYGAALDMEVKATIGCNEAVEHADAVIGSTPNDLTPPTVWIPQRHPYNPGSTNFGCQYGYKQYISNGDFWVWTFAYDVSGPVAATLKYRIDNDGVNPLASNQNETYAGGSEVGEWQSLAMNRRAFPAGNIYNKGEINFFEMPAYISDHFSVQVTGLRSVLVDYYIEATDAKGNTARTAIQHVYVGDGQGATSDRVTVSPNPPVRGFQATLTYDASGGPLASASAVSIHLGKNNWSTIYSPDAAMTRGDGTKWTYTFTVDADATQLDMVFNDGVPNIWDNNNGADWHFTTKSSSAPPPTPSPSPTIGPTVTPGPSPTEGPSPTASPSPTPSLSNPFAMDGVIDAEACEVGGIGGSGFFLAERNGWLYVATNAAANDAFLLVSSDPSTLVNSPWAKAGKVGRWDYFLAREIDNQYASWFSASQVALADDTAKYQKARSGAVLEGAIRKDLAGGAQTYVALALYQTADAGALAGQAPASINGDANIDPNEFQLVITGYSPCSGTPTPSATPTPSLTPSPSSSISPSPSPTPSSTPSPNPSPSPTSSSTPSPSPTPVPTPVIDFAGWILW